MTPDDRTVGQVSTDHSNFPDRSQKEVMHDLFFSEVPSAFDPFEQVISEARCTDALLPCDGRHQCVKSARGASLSFRTS
jgi:hypothetical protein